MHKQRLGIVIASGVGILSSFLPWVTVPFLGSVSGINGDGKITLALFVVALLIALLGDKQSLLFGAKLYITMALGGLAAIVGIYDIISVGDAASGGLGKMVSIGFGLYLVILAGIAVVGIGIALKK